MSETNQPQGLEPLDAPPAEPDGDDQLAKEGADDTEVVTVVDFTNANEIDEPDDEDEDDEPDS